MTHIFTAPLQPATKWFVFNDFRGKRTKHWFYGNPNQHARCVGCNRIRYLKNMGVQAFYDDVRYFCAKGGCAK